MTKKFRSSALLRILVNPKEDANMLKRASVLLQNNNQPEAQLLAGFLRGYASILEELAR